MILPPVSRRRSRHNAPATTMLAPSAISALVVPLVLGPGRRSEFFDPKARAKPAPVLESSERKVRTPQGRMPHELDRKCGRRASRRGDGQCHRKQTARFDSPQGGSLRARVKRWGKSPPRRRRRRRHEKPRSVQGKIGDWAARPIVTGMSQPAKLKRAKAGRRRRKATPREMTTEAPQGVEQNPAYRPQS